ncbi:hypothetical protein FB192DRAFT_1358071 [Mucor lusitanicus]|uniref:C2H2-type domain-containing protein n=1 Tax=Mucor circinelloides f. lusitanicus TaxID=29924 RepID=A0A8H4BLR4_MUCCL|nr:hypothetical protein FB192DRAFT_1358071 [Mucor lusitanicus]
MIKLRRSKRIEATFQSSKTPVSTLDTSEPIDIDPVELENEETENPDNVLNGCLGFGDNVFRYQCSVCNIKTASLRSVLSHRQSVHHISPSPMKNIDLEPDTDDPKYYCKSCEKHSNGWSAYRNHLHKNHHLSLQSLQRKKHPDNITTDPNGFDYHCTACELTYQDEQAYQEHLKKHHEIKPPKCPPASTPAHSNGLYCKVCRRGYRTAETFRRHNSLLHERTKMYDNPEIMPDVMDRNNYCGNCQQAFRDKDSYQQHLFRAHRIDCRRAQAREEAKFDIKDLKRYCRYCDRIFSSIDAYLNHLFLIHSIRRPENNKGGLQPDADDPNNYCRVCQRRYVEIQQFRSHLRTKHNMILQPSQRHKNHKPLPSDANNWNFRGNASKKTMATTRPTYSRRCKDTRHTVLVDQKISSPVAATNISSSTHYCVQGKRSFRNKIVLTSHMKTAHGILVQVDK